jgi:hypothetical protein
MSVVATSDTEEVESLAGIYAVNFAEPAPPAVHGVTVAASKRDSRSIVFNVRNAGNARATFDLRKIIRVQNPGAEPPSPPSNRKAPFAITYRIGNSNVTKAMERGRASIVLNAGETGRVLVKVRALRPLHFRRVIRLTLQATSQTQASATHRASAKVILPVSGD